MSALCTRLNFLNGRLLSSVTKPVMMKCFSHDDSSSRSERHSQHQKQMMARSLPTKRQIPGVQNVVLVASGKGGVGKSTTAVNLALALKQELGSSGVGVLDLDIFGPSLHIMMNLKNHKPDLDKDDNFIPLINYGVHCMSVGFLVATEAAMVWRGPMVMSMVQRLLLKTAWPVGLHTLVVDLPPGTGDVALSVAQLVHVTGAVLVTTPQDVALADVRRGAQMMDKVKVPVLGVVQNMSLYQCSQCGHQEHIFGQDGARLVADELGVPVLGDVPLNKLIREAGDSGQPMAVVAPADTQAAYYLKIAGKLLGRMKEISKRNPPPPA